MMRGAHARLAQGATARPVVPVDGRTDLDGLSGSPLFYVRAGKYFFGGVVVRGNAESKVAHFVDGRWLPKLAERLTEEMTRLAHESFGSTPIR
jgi:hypothetical protein